MAAACEQVEERWLDGLGLEEERCHMPVQVVDGNEWEPQCPGERLRRREADQQRADQPRAARDGHSTDAA